MRGQRSIPQRCPGYRAVRTAPPGQEPQRFAALLDEPTRREHKRRNRLHSLLLLTGIAGVLSLSAMLVWGLAGLVWAVLAVALLMLFAPRVPPEAVMRLYRAREIDQRFEDALVRVLAILSDRAELPRPPRLYVIPSATLNAFTTGGAGDTAIAITEGLLRTLNLREIAGVLAHELSHVRNNDLRVMGLADAMSRFTQALSALALMLAVLNILGILFGVQLVTWWAVLVLYVAPVVSSLLQLALSRAREYDADLEAAQLTGDPPGLISALRKLERYGARFWESIMLPLPGPSIPYPSLLRSHPNTEDRIARLAQLDSRLGRPPIRLPDSPAILSSLSPHLLITPRHRWPGVWY